jgi:hypothetical protein
MRGFLLTALFAVACLLLPSSSAAQEVYSFGAIAPADEVKSKISPDSAIRAMKARLQDLVAAQEGYWLVHGSFTTDVAALGMHVTGLARRDSAAVSVIFAGGAGWSAVATHGSLVTKNCVIYVGEVLNVPRLPITLHDKARPEQTGVPVCDKP